MRENVTRIAMLLVACLILLQCGSTDPGPAHITLVHPGGGPPTSLDDLPGVTVKDNKSQIFFTARVPQSGVSNPRYELVLGPSGGPPSQTLSNYTLAAAENGMTDIEFSTRPYDADLATGYGRLMVTEVLAPDMDYLPETYNLLFKIKIGE